MLSGKLNIEANKRKAFTLIYKQCHKSLQSKLKARENYNNDIKGDLIVMLKAIHEHTMLYQENRYNAKIVIDALRNLLYTKQCSDEDLVDYTRRFKAARDFYKAQQGDKITCEKMAKADDEWDETDNKKMKECRKRASARLISLLYMKNADQNKYGLVLKGLTEQYSLDQDYYLKTINHVTIGLSNHKFDE
jgi:hypothetical protein